MDLKTALEVGALAKNAGDAYAKVAALLDLVKDREHKRQLDAILDELSALKRGIHAADDEIRGLRERLRFKSEEYVWRNPFHYHKAHPDQPLCAKCFVQGIEGRMGAPGQGCNEDYRCCLVCGSTVEITHGGSD